MGLGNFAVSGLRHEKARIFFLIITMIMSTSSALVSFAMEQALAGQVNFNNLFISPFARFSWFIIILMFLASLTFSWLVVYSLLSFRRKDLATMLSLGGVRSEIHAHFLVEILLVAFIGIVGGVILGLLLAFFYHFAISLLGFTSNSFIALPLLIVLIVLIVVGSYFLTSIHLSLRTRKYYTQIAEEENIPLDPFLNRKLSSKYFSLKLAVLTLSRRIMKVQYISFFFVGFILVTLSFGGSVIKNTNIYYMEQAIGSDTYILGHPDVTSLYVQNLAFTGQAFTPSINLTDSQYFIDSDLLSSLSEITIDIDARFFLYTRVREIASITPTVIDGEPTYIVIGGNRSDYFYSFGLDNPLSNWILEDGSFSLDNEHVVVGNSVWYALFDDPFQEKIRIYSSINENWRDDFQVSGIIQDPFGAGKTCYMKLDLLMTTLFHTFTKRYNLIITQVNPINEADLFDFAAANHLSVEPLEPVKQANRGAQNNLWLLNLLSGVPLSIAMIGGIISVLIATAEEERTDLQIIRALGGRKRQILRFTQFKTTLMILIPWIPALLVGIFFSSTVLISSSAPPDIWAFVWIGLNILLSLLVGVVGTSRQSIKISDNYVFGSSSKTQLDT
ncbi:MAG: FtsX-like permease family protein [Promethearchaeota archaeon]